MTIYESIKIHHANEFLMYKTGLIDNNGWWIVNEDGAGEVFLGNDETGYIHDKDQNHK